MNGNDAREKLRNALTASIDVLLQQSDDEFVADVADSDECVDSLADEALAAIEAALRDVGKARLQRARQELKFRRTTAPAKLNLDPAKAKEIFERVRSRNAGLATTLAARGGSSPTAKQMTELLADWLLLGAITEEDLRC